MTEIIRRNQLLIASRTIAIVGLLISGWFFSLWFLAGPDLSYWVSQSMKANTALSLMCIAASLVLLSLSPGSATSHRFSQVFAAGALLIGLLTLAEYFLHLDLGIDQIFALDPAQDESLLFPGRMAPNAAICQFLFGLGLLTIDVRNRRGRYYSDGLFVLVAIMAGTALIGYAYQSAAFYQFSQYLRISQYTAGLLFVLVIGAFLVRPDHPPMKLFFAEGAEGETVRYMFPAAVIFPTLVLGFTVQMRDLEIISRATGYSVAATALVIIFSILAWRSSRAVAASERERRRLFEQERATWQVLNSVGQTIFAELDQEKLVQAVTDAATRLSGAQFGAFFYSLTNEKGDILQLYTISGVPREMFSKFPMPRATKVFEPTFLGTGTVRSEDITKDPRYGHNSPFHGMPSGHLPVRSYLAVPVVNRDGQPVGGLFFGHAKPGIFSEQAEKIVESLAVQAAIAMDNASLYRKLQQSVAMRDEFLSIASHELKTPLTTLKLQSQMRERFMNKGDLTKFSPENLSKMIQNDLSQINRIIRLVDDMLDIGRISSGKLELVLEDFDLNELTSEVVERFRTQFQAAKVELIFEGKYPAMIHADRHRIDQVLVNLLSNALKYGEGKPVTAKVYVNGGRAFGEVVDQGMGVAERDHKLIFERFERAAQGHGISGLGLGLFIVKQFIDAHHGRIAVESGLGKGSKFIFDLPSIG